jgi:catechol 2,3-dioxygenase-like lactoylglutathione lyase family enzyme
MDHKAFMGIDWIDHVVLPVRSLAEASESYERLGLKLTPVTRHEGLGTENRVFFVGDGTNDFYLELLGIHDRAAAARTERGRLYLRYADAGGGLARLMLGTNDLAAVVQALCSTGVQIETETVSREGGAKICDVASLEGMAGIGINAGLIGYVEHREASHARRSAAGFFTHAFPLKRLDHLAAIVPDREATLRAWSGIIPVAHTAGMLAGPGMIVTLLQIGDAILELIAPDGPESHLRGARQGLLSMCAWEVPDIAEAVALARQRGFHPSEPAAGIMPRTRTTTIPGPELAGIDMQLLQYE